MVGLRKTLMQNKSMYIGGSVLHLHHHPPYSQVTEGETRC